MSIYISKLKMLSDIIDDHSDVGRLVIYAGFHGSIDRIRDLCLSKLWTVFIVDGRGWRAHTPSGDTIDPSKFIDYFQNQTELVLTSGSIMKNSHCIT